MTGNIAFLRKAGLTAWMIAAGCAVSFGQITKTIYSIHTIAGGASIGDGGLASQAVLTQPEGIAVDSRGFVYIADAADHRIRRISPEGIVQTIAGNGKPGFSGDGGPAQAAQLNTPYGLCLDRSGNLYVADLSNARIRKIGLDGTITTVVGGGTVAPGGDGDGGPATSSKLNAPRNVAVDSAGNLYVSDFGAHRVYQVSPGGTLATFAGKGVAGYSGDGGPSTFASLCAPAGLAVNSLGILYIADSCNKRVRVVSNGVISTLGDQGKPGTSTLVLNAVTGLAQDKAGSVYIQDGRATTLRFAGQGSITTLPIGGRDVTIDAADRIYATSGTTVNRYASGALTTLAGLVSNLYAGDGGSALEGRFNAPLGLMRDSHGDLYIADSRNRRVRKVNAVGTLSTLAATINTALDTPAALAADNRGYLYIADSAASRIYRIAPDGSASTYAGSAQAGFGGDGLPAIYAQINGPSALSFDQNDNLYFADTGNHRVRKISPEGVISTVAGGSLLDALGDGGAAISARLSSPAGVALDHSGNLYISDTGNGRVRRVDNKGLISTVALLGAPRGLKINASGEILVTDAGTHQLQKIRADGQMSIIAGRGSRGFSGDEGPAELALLDTPTDVWLDTDGSMLIADSGNNRIRRITSETTVVSEALTQLTVVHAATLQQQPVAAGQLISIFGSGLGPATGVSAKLTAEGIFPSILAGTQVLFDGRPAPIFYAQDGQINAQVPFGLAGRTDSDLVVMVAGAAKGRLTIPLQLSAPGLFTLTGGQVAAFNEDGSPNGPDFPALKGSVVALFATGDGILTTDAVDGRPALATKLPGDIFVDIGGYRTQILYAGRAPGLVGVMQINVRLAAGFSPTGAVPVILRVNGEASPANVPIFIK